MQLSKCILMVAAGLFLNPMAIPQDQLTPAVIADLTQQCTHSAYQSCVSALRYHGLGKDDDAMEVLLARAPSALAKERYKIAQTKPKDGFWKIVATAGAPSVDCYTALPPTLTAHFNLSPKALSDAADDSAKSIFLALSDLLARPAGAPDADAWMASVQVYRSCFADPDNLFSAVKKTLGR